MTARALSLHLRKRYSQEKETFFSQRAFCSALFEKNGLSAHLPLTDPDFDVPPSLCEAILRDAESLLGGEPIQYYLKSEFFCGLEFSLERGVLIPRPETELLVSLAVRLAPENALVYDLCCGSGCIGISLCAARPDLSCRAFDLSPIAVKLTQSNASRLIPSADFAVFEADVLGDALWERVHRERPALILANPPYLSALDMERIPENVRREPSLALFGGADGLDFYRVLLAAHQSGSFSLLCEFGATQEESLRLLMESKGQNATFYRDFSDLPRAFFLPASKN